ncbi:MAG: nitrilase-related carbon-nitrogen hydrolase [Bacillota bacterium]|nr:nitrilase-related carbon-nitrogen hydrolase [Bacillota bacterium]
MSLRGWLTEALLTGVKGVLWWRSQPAAIHRFLRRRNLRRSANCAALPAPKVRVALVQTSLSLVPTGEAYAARMLPLVQEAVERGAQLVVFPEDNATSLVGLLPGVERLASSVSLTAGGGAAGEDGGQGSGPAAAGFKVADVFRLLSSATRRVFETTFSELARAFGVYLVPGSAVLAEPDGRVRNIAYLFGPHGELIGRQPKVHLLPLEAEWGLSPGDRFSVFATPLGRIALPVCMDMTYFESFRILSQLGAEIVAVPSANPEPWNLWLVLRGLWPRVQEAEVYGLIASAVGGFLGLEFTGRSSAFAPMELTADGTGVVAQAAGVTTEEIVVADLDLEALRRLRQRSGVRAGFNRELYRAYFPAIYQKGRAERR